jgi:hypothetical protein
MATRNLFLLGRRAGLEDQLTEMLIWLTSAVPEVGGATVQLAFGDIDVDLAQLEATTQHTIATGGRLDALLRTESLALVVESKLGSSYGEGQLRTYIEWLAEQKDVAHRALMTLTANPGEWSADDLAHAAELDVIASPRRWHELHTALSALTAALDDLPARLVQEFLDMLSAEGLIPVAPLQGDELTDAWSRSWAVIERYHAYFRACVETIAEELQATPQWRAASTQSTYAFLEFLTLEGEKIVAAIEESDRNHISSPNLHRDGPIIWFAVEALQWPDWESALVKLEASPPQGWRIRSSRWWGTRPCIWRYLDTVVGTGSYDEQRSALAIAAAKVREWLLSAKGES